MRTQRTTTSAVANQASEPRVNPGNSLSAGESLARSHSTGALRLRATTGVLLRVVEEAGKGRGLATVYGLGVGVKCRMCGRFVYEKPPPDVAGELYHVRAPRAGQPGCWLVLDAPTPDNPGNAINTASASDDKAGNEYVIAVTTRAIAPGKQLLAAYGRTYSRQPGVEAMLENAGSTVGVSVALPRMNSTSRLAKPATTYMRASAAPMLAATPSPGRPSAVRHAGGNVKFRGWLARWLHAPLLQVHGPAERLHVLLESVREAMLADALGQRRRQGRHALHRVQRAGGATAGCPSMRMAGVPAGRSACGVDGDGNGARLAGAPRARQVSGAAVDGAAQRAAHEEPDAVQHRVEQAAEAEQVPEAAVRVAAGAGARRHGVRGNRGDGNAAVAERRAQQHGHAARAVRRRQAGEGEGGGAACGRRQRGHKAARAI